MTTSRVKVAGTLLAGWAGALLSSSIFTFLIWGDLPDAGLHIVALVIGLFALPASFIQTLAAIFGPGVLISEPPILERTGFNIILMAIYWLVLIVINIVSLKRRDTRFALVAGLILLMSSPYWHTKAGYLMSV